MISQVHLIRKAASFLYQFEIMVKIVRLLQRLLKTLHPRPTALLRAPDVLQISEVDHGGNSGRDRTSLHPTKLRRRMVKRLLRKLNPIMSGPRAPRIHSNPSVPWGRTRTSIQGRNSRGLDLVVGTCSRGNGISGETFVSQSNVFLRVISRSFYTSMVYKTFQSIAVYVLIGRSSVRKSAPIIGFNSAVFFMRTAPLEDFCRSKR